MSDPGDDPEETPSTTEAEQREEAEVLAQGTLRTALVSIAALLLITLALMQATGLVDLVPLGDEWALQWLVFLVAAAALVGVELWSWRSDPS